MTPVSPTLRKTGKSAPLKRMVWIKAIISVIMFIVAVFAFEAAGQHKCNEGNPPASLAYIMGMLAASLPWVLARWVWIVPIAFAMVVYAGTHTADALADSYHGEAVTGNPVFSSGRFWHTWISGQYPRDAKSGNK